MGKIFYLMGKSASGKDTIYEDLLVRKDIQLKRLVPYTTRPIRAKETDGVEYHFTDEETLQKLLEEGRVVELREYHTMHGIWKYFTVDDKYIDLEKENYLAIGVPVSFQKLKDYYGEERVIPLYIEVEDGNRLERALKRERKQSCPRYGEMCRRFLADQQDFAEEKLKAAGICHRFHNDEDRQRCIDEVEKYIKYCIDGSDASL